MQQPITIGVFFGGKSQEHAISLVSAHAVLTHLDQSRYRIIAIGIDKQGRWWWQKDRHCLQNTTASQPTPLDQQARPIALVPGDNATLVTLDQPTTQLTLDVALPILHGAYGEDGTIQGMLTGANIPYVGANILSSAICMNKYLLKCLLHSAGLPCGKFQSLKHHQYTGSKAQRQTILNNLGTPCFVKPVDLGSSIAVHKVDNIDALHEAITDALQYSDQLILETYIPGREIECAVIGNENPQATLPAEIEPHREFYSYQAKYFDNKGASFNVPADLPSELQKRIQALALDVYQLANCSGLARVDFFVQDNERIVINEVNTIPGFTPISLFPRMCAQNGLAFPAMLDRLIDLALTHAEQQKRLRAINYSL